MPVRIPDNAYWEREGMETLPYKFRYPFTPLNQNLPQMPRYPTRRIIIEKSEIFPPQLFIIHLINFTLPILRSLQSDPYL